MFDIVTIGDTVIDTHVKIDDASLECDLHKNCKLCLNYAEKIPIADSFQSLGGNAANVACATAKLGFKTAIITTLGMDSNSVLAKQELKKHKVATDFVQMDARTKTRYSVVLSFKGERTILSYHHPRQYVFPKKLPAPDWIYYTSMGKNFQPLQKNVLSFLKKYPTVELAFNPGSYQLKNSLKEVKQMIKRCQILFVNREEAEKITGAKTGSDFSVLTFKLLKMGAEEVVITDGAKGAFVGRGGEGWYMKIYPEKVVAKTGAGDAFAAGYLGARMLRNDISMALKWGTANSAGVVSEVGAQNGILTKKQVEAKVAKFPKIKPVKKRLKD